MRLSSFEVQGFKNLVAPVRLEGLGPINVLHGANNVGKSNLLQAMELFFFLLGREGAPPLQGKTHGFTEDELARSGFPRSEMFNLESPVPIHLEAEAVLAPEDFEMRGLDQIAPFGRLRLGLELRWVGSSVSYSIPRFETADGRDLGKEAFGGPDARDILVALMLVAKNLRIVAEPVARFARIGVSRPVDDGLILALYDARESLAIDISRTWDRFVELMSTFTDILGEGKFVVTYDRKAGRANLLYQTARARVPLQLLGSGIQQIVALFGRVLTSGASIVAVEEPELNLRWSLQERVRDALRDLVGKEGAPSQIFFTSHSGAFESGETFYLMQPGLSGPTVERRPLADLPLVLGGVVPEGPVTGPRAPAYVSSDGTLRVPERIRKAIGVEHGGGVSFVDKGDGVAEMMTHDTFLKRAGLDDDA